MATLPRTPGPPAQRALMNCDALAPYYQTLEYLSFGARLDRSRFLFLREVSRAEHAIICGGGDGRFLARLLRVNPGVVVDFVDLSTKMLEIAERRIAAMGPSSRNRVRFCAGDLHHFSPRPCGYDLIVTNFFLDCFSESEVAAIVTRLAGSATPGAHWVLSDFRCAESLLGRLWTAAVIRLLYAAFRVTTGLRLTRLPNYTAALARTGFMPRSEIMALGGLLYSSLWRLPLHEGASSLAK